MSEPTSADLIAPGQVPARSPVLDPASATHGGMAWHDGTVHLLLIQRLGSWRRPCELSQSSSPIGHTPLDQLQRFSCRLRRRPRRRWTTVRISRLLGAVMKGMVGCRTGADRDVRQPSYCSSPPCFGTHCALAPRHKPPCAASMPQPWTSGVRTVLDVLVLDQCRMHGS